MDDIFLLSLSLSFLFSTIRADILFVNMILSLKSSMFPDMKDYDI